MDTICKIIFLTAAAIIFNIHTGAHDHNHASPDATINFIENKGQWPGDARYKAYLPGGAVFITDNGFVYNFISGEDLERLHRSSYRGGDLPGETMHSDTTDFLRCHAYKVHFTGANANVSYYVQEKRNYYHNYFIGNDPSRWAGKVGLYGLVEQKDVYDGINLRIYGGDAHSVKYDFIVAPGADPGQIMLSFEGVTPELTKDGRLSIKTSVNEVMEQAPYTYQEIDGRKIGIKSGYRLKGAQVMFVFPEGYDDRYPLIIDPEMIFSTYSGSTGGAQCAHSATYDQEGNTYTTALSYEPGWPVTTGAYQVAFPGANPYPGMDYSAAINKYDPAGARLLFSTYFGGSSGSTQPNTLRVNDDNELIMAGAVVTSDMPVTPGVYQTAMRGPSDIYVARFSEDGSMLRAATFIGGSGNESSEIGRNTPYANLGHLLYPISPTDIAVDAAGNIWVTSNSGSPDFPVTQGAYQSVWSGEHDAVLFKLSPGMDTLLYSTFLGGSGWDGGTGIEYNRNNHSVGVVGYTTSPALPTTAGAYMPAVPPAVFLPGDGFALLMDDGNYQVIAVTYLGTSNFDIAMRVTFDCADNFYVAGQSRGNYPVTSIVTQGGLWPGYVFVDKLNPTLSGSIAATLTSIPHSNIVASALGVDKCGNIIVGTFGPEWAQNDVILTPDAFQTDPASMYLAVFQPDFSALKFSTCLGTSFDHYHPGVCRINPEGIMYHCVCSSTDAFPTTPNAFAPAKMNAPAFGWVDNITYKFNWDMAAERTSVVSGGGANTSRTHCVRGCKSARLHYDIRPKQNVPVVLKYRISGDAVNGIDYQWIPDSLVIPPQQTSASIEIKGLLVSGSSVPDPKHAVITLLEPCDYCPEEFRIISRDTVWIYDSLYVKILTPPDTVCPGTPVTITAEIDTTLNFLWTPADQIPDPTQLTIHPVPEKTTTYSITVLQPGAPPTCPPRTVGYTATVEPYPEVTAKDITACLNDEADSLDLFADAEPEDILYNYHWSPPSYLRNEYDHPNKFHAPPGIYRKVITVSTPGAGCSVQDSFSITILPPPSVFVTPSDTMIRYGDTIQLHAAGAVVKWLWYPPTGMDQTDIPEPYVSPLAPELYTVTGVDTLGCSGVAHVRIGVTHFSDIQVPTAFTPNGDGRNDVFRLWNIRHEKLLKFKVFNRYGELVFETQNPQAGWDGTYNGIPADLGVYYYMISISLPDGTYKVFKGDVTLVR